VNTSEETTTRREPDDDRGSEPNKQRGVAVKILTTSDPLRLCQRLNSRLHETPWTLAQAWVTAEQVYPADPTAISDASYVIECVLIRTDGGPTTGDDLPTYLDRLNVLDVQPASHIDERRH
jgi:hypothetical protein